MSDPKILVPIKVEALVLDSNTCAEEKWKDLSLDYEGIYKRMGVHLDTSEPDQLQSDLYTEGVHLHWALPAALTNGIHINGGMVFPAAPNRWLVVRTQLVNGKATTKKWILESDALDGTSRWVIEEKDGTFTTTNIGNATELVPGNWKTESPRLMSPLTAMAPGNPSFAATYATCRNVFGFYDDLEGIDSGVFSYLVTGWYSDPAIDPLNKADDKIKNNIKSKWAVTSSAPYPTSTFLHGFIHTVNWDRNGNYSLPVDRLRVNVGVGYTSVEAKSVQVARQTGAAEKLLSAFFYDILKNMEGASQIGNQVDDRGFASVDGGVLWEVKRTENNDKDNKNEKKDGFPDERKNQGLSERFKDLNKDQQEHDRLMAERMSMLVEFRALSDKLIKEKVEGGTSYSSAITARRKLLQDEINKTGSKIDDFAERVKGHVRWIKGCTAFKKNGTVPAEFELIESKAPRFWRPNDPVALLSGPGIGKSTKYAGSDASGVLQCRLAANIVSALVLEDTATIGERAISPENADLKLTPLGSLTADRIDTISKLYNEAILLDPNWVTEWALSYYRTTDRGNAYVKKLSPVLAAILKGEADGGKQKLRGLLCQGVRMDDPVAKAAAIKAFYNEIAVITWAHPWTPIYMLWRAKWIPSYTEDSKKRAYKNEDWEWKDKTYRHKGPDPAKQIPVEYSGKAILTDGMNGILRSRLKEGSTIDNNLSQAFASFSDALLMRIQAIQLPVLKEEKGNIRRDNSLNDYLTNDTYYFPATDAQSKKGANNFFPVRAGHFSISRLWITDAFGQVQKAIDMDDTGKGKATGELFVPESLKSSYDRSLLALAPRVVQPSRLSFRWGNAGSAKFEPTTSDPATSPICGWLLPDFLNDTLDVYDALGKGCGSIRMTERSTRTLAWAPMPGSPASEKREDIIRNKYLLDFVNGLLVYKNTADKNALLPTLFDLCNDAAMYINASSSQQAPGIAGLIGQPLVLVRASLKLDLLGLPAQPQGWNDGISVSAKNIPTGLEGIDFPVSLGDARNSKDGLIGYFTDKTGFGRMYTAFGRTAKDNAYFESTDISISFTPDQEPAGITLLMDPRGGVQADCGILPSKFIELPHAFIDKSMSNMELHLLTAPFLGSQDNPDIPVSAEPGNSWILKRMLGDTWDQDRKVTGQTPLQANAINSQKIQEGYLVLKPQPAKTS